MRPIILASGSPRRRELLELMGIRDFTVVPSQFDEALLGELAPADRAARLAVIKAAQVAADHPESIVIGADTVVALDRTVLGKPGSPQEAKAMLTALSGRVHTVHTGLAVSCGPRVLCTCESTQVEFAPLTPQEIDDYVATGEPMDKAGAYGIQGRACVFIKGIQGDYYNVVGLPVYKLHTFLEQLKDC